MVTHLIKIHLLSTFLKALSVSVRLPSATYASGGRPSGKLTVAAASISTVCWPSQLYTFLQMDLTVPLGFSTAARRCKRSRNASLIGLIQFGVHALQAIHLSAWECQVHVLDMRTAIQVREAAILLQ